jgi:Major tropism determinant N-terminal domain
MALQIRRGTSSTLSSVTPAEGELLYTTDTNRVYIGGKTGGTGNLVAGGIPLVGVSSVAGRTGAISLNTDDIAEGVNVGKQYFTANRASDAVGAMLAAGTLSGLTVSYNSTTHAITITNTNVIQSGTVQTINGVAGYSPIAYWAANGTALSPSSSLLWNETSNILQNINGTFTIVANNAGRNIVTLDTYISSASTNYLNFRKARGTNISPAIITTGDFLGGVTFSGYDGTVYQTTASIQSRTSLTTPTTSSIMPGLLEFYTSDSLTAAGTLVKRVTIDSTGQLHIGPFYSSDTTGTGQISLRQTVSSSGSSGLLSAAVFRNYYSDINGANISLRKYRGTYASPAVVVQNDSLGGVEARGADSTTSTAASSKINMIVDGTVSAGTVPGAITFSTANSSGALLIAAKIDSTQTFITSGNVVVNGTLTVNGTTVTANSTTVNVEDKLMKLGYLTSGTVSTIGMISGITGTGPWTATISGMTSTVDLIVGSPITATGLATSSLITATATTRATASATAATLSGTTLTLGGTVSGSFAIGMYISGTGISAGTYITAGSGSSWTINATSTANTFTSGAVAGTSNIITVNSTSALRVGTIITSPSVFGGLQTGTNYYVSNIASATQFSVTATAYSTTDFTLTSATGSVSLTYYNGTLGSGGAYTVASIISATSITFTATGGTAPLIGPITTIATSGATEATANGGGIQVYGGTNKTFTWASLTAAWTSSENINLVSTKAYEINGASVLNATTLGAGVTGSSLTGVGTITTGIWNGNLITGQFGGTGVNNGANTITLGGNISTAGSFTLSGAYTTTLNVTANTSVTLPTSGTLVNNLVTSLSSLTSVGTLTNLAVATSGVITGDFDNATFANRTVFKTVTTNATTGIYAVPNGTGTAASWQALNNSNPTNASKILIATNGSTDVQLVSGINGTGTYLPLSFYTNGSSQMVLSTAGVLTMGTNGVGTIVATAATATTNSTAASLGYIGMPQQSKSSAYTTVIGDQGKHIYVTSTATITIDSNANVAYPIGTTIAFIAGTGATVTIAITSDTMYLGGTGTTGSRTLAAFGMATAVKVAATTWFINGTGLT